VDRPLPLAIDHGHAYFLTSSTIGSTDSVRVCATLQIRGAQVDRYTHVLT